MRVHSLVNDFSNSFWPIYSVVPQNILHLHLQTVQFLLRDYMFYSRAQSNENITNIRACHGV